jgi:hypothetical protein
MSPPKKERKPKLKKINVSARTHWKNIIKEVHKDEIPIDLLLSITVNLQDGTSVAIDVKSLIQSGVNPEDLENRLDEKFRSLDSYIENIDFYINIDKVVDTVQPITDHILRDL